MYIYTTINSLSKAERCFWTNKFNLYNKLLIIIDADRSIQGEMIIVIYILATPLDAYGTLICRSENTAQFGWHFTNGGALHIFTSGAEVTPNVSIGFQLIG